MNDIKIDKSECFYLWQDFKDKILYKERYFLKHKILDYLKQYIDNEKIVTKIDHTFKYYRARKYHDEVIDYFALPERIEEIKNNLNKPIESDDTNAKSQMLHLIMLKTDYESKLKNEANGFMGYPKGKNLLPSSDVLVENGRANPQYIRYLYLSASPYTCLAEVRPMLEENVSIAEIKSLKDIKVVDFSYNILNLKNDPLINLLFEINQDFQKCFSGDLREYIPVQYISEFVKKEGFDGIKYNSSMHRYGINFAFFNSDDFEDVSSLIYKLDSVYIKAKCINTPLKDDLVHHELLNPFSNHARSLKKRMEEYHLYNPKIRRGREEKDKDKDKDKEE